MHTGLWNGLTHPFRLLDFDHIKIHTPGSIFCETTWLWGNLCQQGGAHYWKCRAAEYMHMRAAQNIGNSWSASATAMPILHSTLFQGRITEWTITCHKWIQRYTCVILKVTYWVSKLCSSFSILNRTRHFRYWVLLCPQVEGWGST
jgi:hypothetical protein